jgi:hypothetical protein
MLVGDTGIEVWTTMNVQHIEARPSGVVDNQPKERILIHITVNPSTAMLICRGRRVADYLHADCNSRTVATIGGGATGFSNSDNRHRVRIRHSSESHRGHNQFTIGFGSALPGATIAYWQGVRLALRRDAGSHKGERAEA